jgi:dihydropteroate synthase
MILRLRDRELRWPRRPLVMGIVNVNDDSFSGDGTLDIDQALVQAAAHIQAGADIIDVGAESARTNREPISVAEEVDRLAPFIERFHTQAESSRFEDQQSPTLLSVNTWRPDVVRQVLPLGVDLLNDIGALPDGENASLCAEHGSALLIMHSVGEPKVPHTGQRYADVMAELLRFFATKLALAASAGLSKEATVLDPGIDFAKDRADNLRIFRELEQITDLRRPIVLPVSRKTVIGEVLGIDSPAARDAGSLACSVAGLLRGAAILRVHDTRSTASAVGILNALQA